MIRFSRKQLRIPYLVFLLVFVVLPLFVILYYALTNGEGQFTWENHGNFVLQPYDCCYNNDCLFIDCVSDCLYTGAGQSETGTGLCDFACDANVD